MRKTKHEKIGGGKEIMRKLVLLLSMVMILLLIPGNVLSMESVDAEQEAARVKTGLSVKTSVAKSTSAGEEDGLAQADAVIVAVTVDGEGVITNCAIDSAQTRINFSGDGEIVTPMDKVFAGKQELGEDYGMVVASSIGKEWYEQADALAAYVTGKTIEEVKSIAVNEEGVPTEAELTSSVTIHITDYISGVEKAVANAEFRGANADDKLGIGVITTIDMSKNATAEEDGLAQAYSSIAAVTFDSNHVVTSCIIDAVQANVGFNQSGEITSDLSVEPKTKNELGDDYGMVVASSIGKEWYEQANAFAQYAVGKTVEEIKGIALDEEGRAAESELTSSVTIHVGPFITIIEKALHSVE